MVGGLISLAGSLSAEVRYGDGSCVCNLEVDHHKGKIFLAYAMEQN